ncbi:MAG TPA: helix-turn-helix transcriptional regulator [Gemmatimonadaceae bacterium]|nr:helix-turn-helix transcriptional regulator [Gemmatimonadaceae bacterium]
MAARTSGADRPSRIARQSPRFAAEARALGERLRELRESRGWTLERAAEATNLDLKHFQKVEAGKLNVTLVTLVRIAEGFGEPMASLFKASRSKARK